MAVVVSNLAKLKALQGLLTWATLDVRALVLDASQATDPDRDFVSQLTGELTGTGYSRKTLTGKTVTRDDVDNQAVGDGDPLIWPAIDSGLADRLVLYVHVTNDADSWIISYHDIEDAGGDPITTSGGALTIPPSAIDGFLKVVTGEG